MKNLFDLTGRNAVVIGGAGGIGQEIAKALAAYGAEVAIASRNEEKLKAVAAQIGAEVGKEIHYLTVDAGDESSIKELVETSVAKFGKVDILVNSQGVNLKHGALDEDSVAKLDETYRINIRGVMLCCREFARHMKENHYGRIINLSSVRAYGAAPGGGQALSYGTSKSAVNMLTKQLAVELAKDGITVNAIGPTVTKTEMLAKVMTPEFEARMSAKIPMGRMQVPEDCAGPAVFLASDASAFITGTTLYVDGGLTNQC